MTRFFTERLWPLCCSLKLAIWLASAATALAIGGSLTLPSNPAIFGDLDRLPLGDWLRTALPRAPGLTWWLPLTGTLIVLLGLNTLCCFCDWLLHLRHRWRKSGEYLIHLGFVLVLAAFCWGSAAGFRVENQRLGIGAALAVPDHPGHYLRLEALEPVFAAGRPVDIHATVALLRGDELLQRDDIRFNHPLTYQGLVVLAESFGRETQGFRFLLEGRKAVVLEQNSILDLDDGSRLEVLRFFPHAVRLGLGTVQNRSDEPVRPALEFRLTAPGGENVQGWYFLAEGLPPELRRAGMELRPLGPVYRPYGLLKLTYDPGAGLALTGAAAMLLGALIALFSFYRKRRLGDHPDVA